MIGRITQQMTSASTLAGIEQADQRLSDTQNEMSTGQRINQPSDDPYGTSLAISIGGEISALGSYGRSVSDATAWTQVADSSMMSMNTMVQRVRELTVEAGNGTLSSSDLNDIAGEVDQLTEAIKQEANTQYAGQYIFSGTATTTAPYGSGDTYQGNTSQVTRRIAAGTTIPISQDISSLLGNGQSPGDGKLLDTLRTLSADLKSGNTSAVSGSDLQNLDANMSTLSQLQSDVGATESRLQLASSRITDMQTSDAQRLSTDKDADMAQLAINFSTQQAAYTAALKAGAEIIKPSLLDFLGAA
jgi:flagellar hook-associated protein 3 FlgL